jgi:hypothetical protein
VKIDWDATHYSQRLPKRPARPGTNTAKDSEASIRRSYPPWSDLTAAGLTISSPCVVVDMDNVILAWYLPGALSDSRQVNRLICLISAAYLTFLTSFQGAMMAATKKLYLLLGGHQSGTSWRVDPETFCQGQEVPIGVINFSLGWFERAHQVSSLACKVLPFGSLFRPRRPCSQRHRPVQISAQNPAPALPWTG